MALARGAGVVMIGRKTPRPKSLHAMHLARELLRGPATMEELGRRAGLSRSTVLRLLKTLERDGLMIRGRGKELPQRLGIGWSSWAAWLDRARR